MVPLAVCRRGKPNRAKVDHPANTPGSASTLAPAATHRSLQDHPLDGCAAALRDRRLYLLRGKVEAGIASHGDDLRGELLKVIEEVQTLLQLHIGKYERAELV